jgi:hypothetical protein
MVSSMGGLAARGRSPMGNNNNHHLLPDGQRPTGGAIRVRCAVRPTAGELPEAEGREVEDVIVPFDRAGVGARRAEERRSEREGGEGGEDEPRESPPWRRVRCPPGGAAAGGVAAEELARVEAEQHLGSEARSVGRERAETRGRHMGDTCMGPGHTAHERGARGDMAPRLAAACRVWRCAECTALGSTLGRRCSPLEI